MDGEGYGAWRSITAPDAVSLVFGFPYPESFPNEELVAAARAVFDEEGDVALQYTGGEYAGALADVVAEHARDRGVDCDPGDVVLTNGSTRAIDAVCRTFLEPGDGVFAEAPTFMGALNLFRGYDAAVTGLPTDADGLDVGALETELAARRAAGRPAPKLLYTIPTFQNPTGATMPLERRRRLLELAAEYDFVVLEDDAYGALRYDGDPVPPLKALDEEGRVVRVGTFSKTIAPGVRTGWVVAEGEIREQVERMNPGGTNTFTRGVLARYCREGHFERNVEAFRGEYERRRDRMLDALDAHMPPEATWTDPDGGFFVWVTLPEGLDSAALLPEAAEEGVLYLPGEHFYPDGGDERGERGLRLSFSYAAPDEIDRGIEGLARACQRVLDAR
ncbi:PLP-dependent aminotransferase family protein [Halogeometricum luteum]|uniref:PLP-dependent aminotransferase family protein n=1 Tax=Halogeometricum luteum TaxID=2950537 RepID=A0ABU2G198_9EURY|nr:PLP-dependent aminotransferase family protein [Halogeometricum sp. S3BR5-2]MDS0294552.1 PLP-dependent aminotransferase family protein [Halogeometricum sp. S3BR5-2]